MKSYQLIHQLLTLVEKQEKEDNGAELSLRDFAGFLNSHLSQPDNNSFRPDVRLGDKENNIQQNQAYQLDNNIGRLFVYMSRYARSYIKKALDGTPLQSPEDFTCLAILLTHDHLSKTDLINKNLQEKTSGTEVIRRLIEAGLIDQWNDEKDKRGKRIGITQKGKELLYAVFKDMSMVGQIVTGTLTLSEKLTLQYLLQKLENFHYHHHELKTVQTKADLRTVAAQLAD